MLGDLNAGNIYLNQQKYQHSGITNFDHSLSEAAEALDLQQLIRQPTRISDTCQNLRDLIFISNGSSILDSGTLSSFANLDHFPIYATIRVSLPPENTQTTHRHMWDYSKLNAPLLTAHLQTSKTP